MQSVIEAWRRKEEEQEKDGVGGGGAPWTDWLHRVVWALSPLRKQSSRCSLAAGVSLPQQWSLFNEPSMRTCILPHRFKVQRYEVTCSPEARRAPIAHSKVRTSNLLQWRAQMGCPMRHYGILRLERIPDTESPSKMRFGRWGCHGENNHSLTDVSI